MQCGDDDEASTGSTTPDFDAGAATLQYRSLTERHSPRLSTAAVIPDRSTSCDRRLVALAVKSGTRRGPFPISTIAPPRRAVVPTVLLIAGLVLLVGGAVLAVLPRRR